MNWMDRQTRKALADNMAALMEAMGGWSQVKLAEVSGVAQTTIGNMLDPDRGIDPQLGKIEAIAVAFRVETW